MNADIVFISDLHLTAARPDITAAFIAFLRQARDSLQALYILGDLFEVWLGDDDPDPANRAVVSALREVADSGVAVFFMHGNRDFLIGTDFARASGCTLLADPTLMDIHGVPTLLMHGDNLCIGDTDYQAFRRQVRDPRWQQAFLSKPLPERALLAQTAREHSQASTQTKAAAIMDVDQSSVEQTMRDYGVKRLIHGHTHRPAVHDFSLDGSPAQRIVLGDWYDQGSALVCRPECCDLVTLPMQSHLSA